MPSSSPDQLRFCTLPIYSSSSFCTLLTTTTQASLAVVQLVYCPVHPSVPFLPRLHKQASLLCSSCTVQLILLYPSYHDYTSKPRCCAARVLSSSSCSSKPRKQLLPQISRFEFSDTYCTRTGDSHQSAAVYSVWRWVTRPSPSLRLTRWLPLHAT